MCNPLFFDIITSNAGKGMEEDNMAENKLRKRNEIPAQYKWNMQDMFASDELWEQEAEQVLALAKEMEGYNVLPFFYYHSANTTKNAPLEMFYNINCTKMRRCVCISAIFFVSLPC